MKKSFLAASFLFVVAALGFAGDFSLRLLPSYGVLLDNHPLNNPLSIGLSADIAPFTIRGRDTVYLGLQGNYVPLKARGISGLQLINGDIALGYNLTVIDRLTLGLEGYVGLWTVPDNKEMGLEGEKGISYGGRFTTYFNVIPELSLGAFAGYNTFYNGKEYFIKNVDLGLALKYSFTKGLFASTDIITVEEELQPIFPVFYSRYSETGFGKMVFVNNEKNDISDVEVSVFIEQYMVNPDVCATFDKVKRGDSFEAELTCFLNESVLNNLVAEKADAKITVSYKSLGKKMTYSQTVELQALNRNSMTWEDDRRAAAFVSPRDGTANYFANFVKHTVNDSLRSNVPENIQYAAAMFSTLKMFGINYVIDPSSAFTDNTGTGQVDFLQFPYQTLLYSGGDCDDLSILNCSLLEAIGIETAFITCPGHIFIAFDAGVPVEQAAKAGDCIVMNGKVWVPLEITLCQDTFALERSTAMREWKKYPKERALIPLKDAWQEYKPVGIPDSSVKIDMPSRSKIITGFKNAF